MKELYIKPIIRAFYRGPGEFDPSSRGVASSGLTNFYPYPSSIAGLLGWLIGSGLGESLDWIDELISVLGEDIYIRGPYIYLNSKKYLIYDLKTKAIVELNDKPLKIDIHKRDLNKFRNSNYILIDEDIFREWIGIALEVRSEKKKTVREGMLYAETVIDVEAFPNMEKGRSSDFGYIYEIYGLEKDIKGLYRFGGEESKAYIISKDANSTLVDKYFTVDSEYLGLYIVSPLLFPTGLDNEELARYIIREIKDITGVDIEHDDIIGGKVLLIGETKILGAGISSATGVRRLSRRPLYEALMPGSIIIVKPKNFDIIHVKNLYIKGMGAASQIGYGTIFPFKPVIEEVIG